MVLIITSSDDEHTPLVSSRLRKAGLNYCRFHSDSFPGRSSSSLEYRPDLRAVLTADTSEGKQTINLDDITSVWNRRPKPCIIDASLEGRTADFARRESEYFLRSLYRILKDRRWLTYPAVVSDADCKPHQLAVANLCGLSTPKTIITNDPEVALDFSQRCPSRMIYKGLSGYMALSERGSVQEAIFTNLITPDGLMARKDEIRYAPCIFQEYIEKDYEVRATIVDRHILAAAIESQNSAISSIDWRHYDLSNTPYTPIVLPDHVNESLLRLMEHYGLKFGCIDMVVTPGGEHVFLELNPNGNWYWVEALTKLPIATEISCYLGEPQAAREVILARINGA